MAFQKQVKQTQALGSAGQISKAFHNYCNTFSAIAGDDKICVGAFVIMELIKQLVPAVLPIPFSLYFDIFDGFAYCANFEGKEYFMKYPKKDFVKLSKDMDKGVRDFLELDEHQPLTETNILVTYNTLFTNE